MILPLMAPSLVAGWSLYSILSWVRSASAMLAVGVSGGGQAILNLDLGTFPLLATLSVVITAVSTTVNC